MKEFLILVTLCLISCNQNKNEYDEYAIENNTIAVDEFSTDSAATNSKKIVEENLTKKKTYEEDLNTSAIEEINDSIKKIPTHKNAREVNNKVLDFDINVLLIFDVLVASSMLACLFIKKEKPNKKN
jgi:hypothetical protein